MDKVEGMRAFVQVVATGGFAAAARELGVSRSAVNKLVIQLENHLGVQLLHRTTRRVSPTESGLSFYDRCLDILSAIEEAELAVSRIHQEPRGNLRINAPMSFGILHLAPAITDFMLYYPDLNVQLTLNDRLIDPIEEGFDITLRISETNEFPGVITHGIATSQQIICASPRYIEQWGSPSILTICIDIFACTTVIYLVANIGSLASKVQNTPSLFKVNYAPIMGMY